MFSDLVGPLTNRHHLQAQSTVVELDDLTAEPLHDLDRRDLELAEPRNEAARALIRKAMSRLAPAHHGAYTGAFREHAAWYVYGLALQDRKGKVLAVKVGYSSDPASRQAAYNHGLATEVTGLHWHLAYPPAVGSEEAARHIEQQVLQRFAGHRLDSNGEILTSLSLNDVLSAAMDAMTRMKS